MIYINIPFYTVYALLFNLRQVFAIKMFSLGTRKNRESLTDSSSATYAEYVIYA